MVQRTDSGRRVAVLAGLMLVAVAIVLAPWGTTNEAPASLADAVESGDSDLAAELLAEGADPDQPRVFGMTPLMRAVLRDDAALVTLLLESGADASAKAPEGLELTHLAAQTDAVDALEVVLAWGADPESRSLNGMNALDHAAATGSSQVVIALVRHGLDPDARSEVIAQGHGYPRDRGGTPLIIATAAGEQEAVEALLDSGADINRTSASEHTALLVGVWTDQSPGLIELLLRAGADPSVVAECDEACSAPPGDALDWARGLGRQELIAILGSVDDARSS